MAHAERPVRPTPCPLFSWQAPLSCWLCSRALCCRCSWGRLLRWPHIRALCRCYALPLPALHSAHVHLLALPLAISSSFLLRCGLPSVVLTFNQSRSHLLHSLQGVRWLGGFARLVSHSTEKVAGGYRNTLLITGGWWDGIGGCRWWACTGTCAGEMNLVWSATAAAGTSLHGTASTLFSSAALTTPMCRRAEPAEPAFPAGACRPCAAGRRTHLPLGPLPAAAVQVGWGL